MSVYNDIVKGLNEAIDYEKGELTDVKVDRIQIAQLPHYEGEKVKMIRMRQKMTQQIFSGVLGVSQKTVEAWEAGRNIPNGPAQRMLELMDKDDSILEKYAILTRQ
ncbi:MAG: transcriptional regulator [Eubacteriales bacterium]|nr:transcriptional regulator [Eubacteriales bacterium]